jgi:hypothetical protein
MEHMWKGKTGKAFVKPSPVGLYDAPGELSDLVEEDTKRMHGDRRDIVSGRQHGTKEIESLLR